MRDPESEEAVISKRLFFWLLSNVAVLIVLPVLAYRHITAEVRVDVLREFAAGDLAATQGDNAIIPTAGFALFLLLVLLLLNFIIWVIARLRAHRSLPNRR